MPGIVSMLQSGRILAASASILKAGLSAHTHTEEGTMSDVISKEQLLQEFAEAFEKLISTATEVAQRGVTQQRDRWGPREVVAHMAGWEIMATVRIPRIVAGMPPLEFSDETQQEVMDAAMNAAFVTLVGDQPLNMLCGMLRQAYRHTVEILRQVDEQRFQPGEYVYERTRGVIDHCQEHREKLAPN